MVARAKWSMLFIRNTYMSPGAAELAMSQSMQSKEWGFRGLAEQPTEYALKTTKMMLLGRL
jgi:hypothetical protein